jgi:hypothetical protein
MPITMKQVTQTEHRATYTTWLVSGYVNGKRIRIRCKTEQEARIKKSEQETAAINSERSARFIQTRLTAAQLSEAESCVDRLQPKYTLTEAVDFFLQNFHAPEFTITVGESSTKFRAAMEGVVRDRTLIQLKSSLGQFERFTDNANLHEVTSELIERFLQSLRARNGTDKASRKTWNNVRGDIHQFFEWCREKQQRYVSTNPAAEVKRFTIDSGHVEVLTTKRCRELMDHVAEFKDGKWVRYFSLALFAGIRPGPLGELEKLADNSELVDLENKVIRITAAISKTRKPRQVRIRPNLLLWLRKYSGEILPGNDRNEISAIRKKFELSHDVLRHSFISYHAMMFGSFVETAIESGNSEQIIRDHYFNTVTKAAAKEFWKIEPTNS